MNNEKLPCSDKLAFDTKDQANSTLVVSEYRYGNKLKVYKCSHCNLWHIASIANA